PAGWHVLLRRRPPGTPPTPHPTVIAGKSFEDALAAAPRADPGGDEKQIRRSEGIFAVRVYTPGGYSSLVAGESPVESHGASLLGSREPGLLPVARAAGGPHHLRRALRSGPEPGLRLRPLPGGVEGPRLQPHANLLRHVPGDPRHLQDPGQHARAGGPGP